MDKDTAHALVIALTSQSEFHMKVVKTLIEVTKAVPEDARLKVANSVRELLDEHSEELRDLRAFAELLYKGYPND